MASEEDKRAKILAEYQASLQDESEDEADFDPADPDDDEGTAVLECAVLTGSLHLNEEGRLIYSGTWCMKSELNAEEATIKKNSKFKLKSQDSFYPVSDESVLSDGRTLFDFDRPTLSQAAGASRLPEQRLLVFDGFYFEASPANSAEASNGDKPQQGKKVKERGVEVAIACDTSGIPPIYKIAGRGSNEYGQFGIEGTYTPPSNDEGKGEGSKRCKHKGPSAKAVCRKTYAFATAAKGDVEEDDSFDDDFDDKAEWGEAVELMEDANMSIEELKRKYYGGGVTDEDDKDDDGGGKVAAKKFRLDDSDEEYAF